MFLIIFSFYIVASLIGNIQAQIKTVTYNQAPDLIINNPERGFYIHTEVFSSKYQALDSYTLNSFRSKNNITLILRVFYLESFINSPISSSYLNNVQADLNKVRDAGLKCIVRFAYSNDNTNGKPFDASKTQVLQHLSQLKSILINNVDVIAVVQAGFIGVWGEWYYSNNFGLESLSATDFANRKSVVDTFLDALPKDRMIQIRTPLLKQKMYGRKDTLTSSQAFDGSNISRLGHHNDCFLASEDDYGTYSDIKTEHPYLEKETLYTAMGGETCHVNKPRSQCPTALAEMKRFHYSYLNSGYEPNVLNGFKTGGCYQEIFNKLGYRFELVNGVYPTLISLSSPQLVLKITLRNSGFASLYNKRNVNLVLKNGNNEYSIQLKSTDPRFWYSNTEFTISETVTLPKNVTPGTYNLFLSLPDSAASLASRSEYSIRFANNAAQWDSVKGFNSLLHSINITN